MEEEAQIASATGATSGLSGTTSQVEQERLLLSEMAEVADAARDLPDARIVKLVEWIRVNMCPGLPSLDDSPVPTTPAAWNGVRILIFTEYEDTLRYIKRSLEGLVALTDRGAERIAVYNGPTPQARRQEIQASFNKDPKKDPLRILIATDAGREGINLQSHCCHLFHFDVPWNPSRMEQRNGRIDRKLQPSPQVWCHYFYYHQRAEDRILKRLVEKTETIKRELGSLAQVIEGQLAEVMAGGIRHRDLDRMEQQINTADLDPARKQVVQEELEEETRERRGKLVEEIETLRGRLATSKEWIGLEEDHFRAAISCSLEMMGAEPLTPVTGKGMEVGPVGRFHFPALDQRDGADPTWANTLDTLRVPRKRDQKPWEWRKESPIRPVVFEDAGTMDADVVHLHLEHRVVQRLLGRFLAQGFVHHDLSRACLACSTDPIPRVILVGRLCLYGAGAARLHEVLISVTARWYEADMLDRPLVPYKRDAEEKTMQLLEKALLANLQRPIEQRVQEKLLATCAMDVRDLVPYLEARGEEIAAEAMKALTARGTREAADMRKILENQRDQIARTVEKHASSQMEFQWDDQEKRQLESNKRHWGSRLEAIETELDSEPDRIRAVYDVKARRVEPVGLVYLWPVTG
jgi:Helicase conserved C-terminal domain